MKHTKGKWTYKDSDEQIIIVGGDSRDYIATVQIQQHGGGVIAETMKGRRKANARLIAAAPDLKKACEFTCSDICPDTNFCVDNICPIKEAKAKAEGV